jgi:ankyrin repeat protein
MKYDVRIVCVFLVAFCSTSFNGQYIFGMSFYVAAQAYYEDLAEHQLAQQQITVILNSKNPNFIELHQLIEQEATRASQTKEHFLNNYLIACLSNRVLTNDRVLENLLKLGADPNCRYLAGFCYELNNRTPLMMAVASRQFSLLIDLLLYNGADATAYDDNGDTALILAAAHQNSLNVVTAIVQALKNEAYAQAHGWVQTLKNAWLACPAEVIDTYIEPLLSNSYQYINHQNRFGNTALMYAATCNDYAMVAYLLKNGADALLKNRVGLTAIDHTINVNIKTLLQQHMR